VGVAERNQEKEFERLRRDWGGEKKKRPTRKTPAKKMTI